MSGRWWRAYNGARHDAKLLRLSDKHFRWWFNLICVAAERDGYLPDHADLCAEFRTSAKAMTEILDALVAARLFDHDETGIRAHNWNERQYKSDVSNERVKRYRERQRNAECNVTETPSENRVQITDTETDKLVGADAPPTKAKRASRIPDDWAMTTECRAYANSQGLNPDRVAEAFTDYWRAQGGSNARKLDWDAAFRTWCRRQAEQQPKATAPRNGYHRPTEATLSDEPWEPRMNGWRDKRFWLPMVWGPAPDQPGTRVPSQYRTNRQEAAE
jgi:hypothetical protein